MLIDLADLSGEFKFSIVFDYANMFYDVEFKCIETVIFMCICLASDVYHI